MSNERDRQVFNTAWTDSRLVACPECDLLQRLPDLDDGASARCPRCDHQLARARSDSRNRTLALALAAAILFVTMNCVPMLGLSVAGQKSFTTVLGGAAHLWSHGEQPVAVVVLLTTVLAPALQLGLMLAVLLATFADPVPRWAGSLIRHHPATATWSMIEVMLLGVLVALIKIADYATVVTGPALFLIVVLIFLLAAIQGSFDPRLVWDGIEWVADGNPAPTAASLPEALR